MPGNKVPDPGSQKRDLPPGVGGGVMAEDDITRLLKGLRQGDQEAKSRLVSLVHEELHRMAARMMRRERSNHTLQPTALVNEAYMRLVEKNATDWKDRAHFYGVASEVMRHILIDHARQRLSKKRSA